MKKLLSRSCLAILLLATFQPLSAQLLRRGKPSQSNSVSGELVVDGEKRSFNIHFPATKDHPSLLPVVIALHGGGGSAEQFEKTSRLSEKADQAGFLVVYPNGTGMIQTWNAGECCGRAMKDRVDDVRFICLLIEKILRDYPADGHRVYVTGHSNGGMLGYRLACELSDKIAAIAVNSCSMVCDGAAPARPMPILHMHSRNDKRVPYLGGPGITGIQYLALEEVFVRWASWDHCSIKSEEAGNGYHLTTWTSPDTDCSIRYYLTDDGGHGWPGGLPGGLLSDPPSQSIHANDLLWDFFARYRLP
ncbi:MAG: alpha/beta fold hydrolase [Marinilabiliales bacterium]|nr:alpha/beta fold hydrolase [Marinilabiliales bacterium]